MQLFSCALDVGTQKLRIRTTVMSIIEDGDAELLINSLFQIHVRLATFSCYFCEIPNASPMV